MLFHSYRGFKISVLSQALNVLCCLSIMGMFTPVSNILRGTEDGLAILPVFPVFASRILKMLQTTGCWVSFDITQLPSN